MVSENTAEPDPTEELCAASGLQSRNISHLVNILIRRPGAGLVPNAGPDRAKSVKVWGGCPEISLRMGSKCEIGQVVLPASPR